MDLLLVGGGGREHALLKALLKCRGVDKVYVLPGNGAMAGNGVRCVPIQPTQITEIADFASSHQVDFAVIGPDDPLAQKAHVTREDLAGLPLMLPQRLNVQSELANWFGKGLEALDIAFTGNLKSSKLPAVHQGWGYAIVVEGAPGVLNPDYVVSRPLYPELTAGTVLAWKRGQTFGRATEKFIEHIRCFSGMDQP